MENIHVLYIPLRSSHTGNQMALVAAKVIVEVCVKDWERKLIVISTYGACNMTGNYYGAVPRL